MNKHTSVYIVANLLTLLLHAQSVVDLILLSRKNITVLCVRVVQYLYNLTAKN